MTYLSTSCRTALVWFFAVVLDFALTGSAIESHMFVLFYDIHYVILVNHISSHHIYINVGQRAIVALGGLYVVA